MYCQCWRENPHCQETMDPAVGTVPFTPLTTLFVSDQFRCSASPSPTLPSGIACTHAQRSSCNRLLPIIVVTVHYSDTGNIFQVFWSCWSKSVVQYHHQLSKSINVILQYKFFAWFRLSIGFSKACCRHSHEPGYTEPIYLTRGRSGRDNDNKEIIVYVHMIMDRFNLMKMIAVTILIIT